MGTTSACAENTGTRDFVHMELGNYLRVRGEYLNRNEKLLKHQELPPRARRIRKCGSTAVRMTGTTSACAENTGSTPPPDPRDGNYLRVRGEYSSSRSHVPSQRELPPRARRIPLVTPGPKAQGGTTSACAENTPGSTT